MRAPTALFDREGDVLHPSELTRGPWDHAFLHGGAVCGAVGWAIERAQTDPAFALTRMTVEIRSMVGLVPLETAAFVVKAGRRSRVIEATLSHDNRVLVRATSQWAIHDPAALPRLGVTASWGKTG